MFQNPSKTHRNFTAWSVQSPLQTFMFAVDLRTKYDRFSGWHMNATESHCDHYQNGSLLETVEYPQRLQKRPSSGLVVRGSNVGAQCTAIFGMQVASLMKVCDSLPLSFHLSLNVHSTRTWHSISLAKRSKPTARRENQLLHISHL